MRVIFLSDLHITSTSSPETSPWVQHFCDFICSTSAEPTYIFVLGDIINGGDKLAFQTASKIFDYIKQRLQYIDHHFFFLPGNHDYCDSTLNAFQQFVESHQSNVCPPFIFLTDKTWNVTIEDTNFIVTDSINGGQYNLPGSLDLPGIKRCTVPNLTNVLLMHHSIEFEDEGTHTGITNKSESITCFKEIGISYVFHGHAHATRKIGLSDQIFHCGVGSIGLTTDKLNDLVNEQEQFLEIRISSKYVETVVNYLFRGGEQRYMETFLRPVTTTYYKDRTTVLLNNYDPPETYIERYVLTREQACNDDFWLALNKDKRIKLTDAVQAHHRLLLIADAGLGKSTELKNLAFTISRDNRYILPILLSLNIYKGEPILKYLYSTYPNYKTLNPAHFLLILDGYEEMENPHHFKRELNSLLLKHPNIRICISMRSNFLLSSSGAFHDFKVYQLLPLSHKDIVDTLQQHAINAEEFLYTCSVKRLDNLLSNPFYLNEIINLYATSGTLPLPHELMQQIIELRIVKDSQKFEYAKSHTLEESKYELQIALTKMALGMQLLNIAHCPDSEYCRILPDKDERELVKLSSLLIKNPTGYQFSHNIFREYLVAEYLSGGSLDDILPLVSLADGKFINHNWFNILGFLLQIQTSVPLLEWIKKTEPLLLTRLESDRVSENLRFELLKSTLEDIESRNTWFRSEICTEEQLAAFCQCKPSLELLLSHIDNPAHFRSLHFCLRIISYFTDCYGLEDLIGESLTKCATQTELRSEERRIAISAIANLGLANSEITKKIMTVLGPCSDTYIRTGIYELLLIAKHSDDYVDFLLSGLRQANHVSRGKITNGSEGYYLRECLVQISSPEAIAKALSWYSKKENHHFYFFEKDKIFIDIRLKAVHCYNSGSIELFDVMYEFLLAASINYSSTNVDYAIDFFVATATAQQAFTRFLDSSCLHKDFIIACFMEKEPQILDFFCSQYLANQLPDDSVFEHFATSWRNRSDFFVKCAPVLESKAGIVLEPPEPTKSHAELEQEDIQCFFNALFDQGEMETLLNKLLSVQDNPELTINQLTYRPIAQYPTGAKELHYAIIYHGKKECKVKDFFADINWDYFMLERIQHLLDQNAAIKLTNEQLKRMQQIFDSLLSTVDYHTAYSKNEDSSCSLSGELYYCIFIKKHLDIVAPSSYYIGLLEVPYHFMDGHDIEGKYKYLEDHLPLEVIKKRVAYLLAHETRNDIISDLLYACKRYHLLEGKDRAISYCMNNTIPAHRKHIALEYLRDVFGTEVLVNNLVTNVDDSTFDAIVSVLGDDAVKIAPLIISHYKRRKSNFLLQCMITMNLPEGLTEYIQESRHLNHPVDASNDISHLTESISCISSPSLIPLLCEAVELCFSDGFEDVSFHSLYSSLYNAFQKCATSDFHATISALEQMRITSNSNLEKIGFCNMTMDSIQSSHRDKLAKCWSISEVRDFLQTIY